MKNQKAFTLLELLITSSITALLMLAISSLFISFLATAYKSRISQNLRESGGNAITQIIDMIRSSGEITSTCDSATPLDHIIVIGADGVESTIMEEDDRIASVSATNKFYLTENSANPNYVSDLIFNCDLTPEGTKYIEVSFTLHDGDNEASRSARSTTLDFSSGVATRN
jgi:prepilin-type N-terminal cleavage/methylation domain-containing protein